MSKSWRSLPAVLCLCATPALADVWDTQTDNDDDSGAQNELVHGTTQTHDLGVRPGPVADQDWFRIPQKPYASYEVVVDGVSGDLGSLLVDRWIVLGGQQVVQSSSPVVQGSPGFSRALRWTNATSSTVTFQRIRVAGGECGTDCGSNDVYSLRMRETTVRVQRFDTTGTSQTALFVGNGSESNVSGTVYYWSSLGALLASTSIGVVPRGQLTLWVDHTLQNSGHVTITHDGAWGALNATSIIVDPETGYSFDTQGVSLP